MSFFGAHESHDAVDVDLSLAQLSNFDELVAANLLDGPTAPEPEPTPEEPTPEEPTPEMPEPGVPSPGQPGCHKTKNERRQVVQPPQSCPNVPANQFQLQVASGWRATKIAGGLTMPRQVVIDPLNNLLLLQNGLGVTHHTMNAQGCITATKTLITIRNLNHGLWVSPDGTKLFASSLDIVYQWDYNAQAGTVANQRTIVTGMNSGGHVTRTLIQAPAHPNLLIISRGSDGNLDMPTGIQSTQRAVVKVFDLNTVPQNGYPYNTGGWNAGWGLRNEVGLVVDPSNKLWGLENSADDISRIVNGQTTDVHNDNPAEELNYLGDPSVPNNQWYGYPTCFTVWGPNTFPSGTNLRVGQQFLQQPNSTFTDQTCEQRSVAPRLSFQAHSAPMDGKFSPDGNTMYVTFHGSWNRQTPTGYKVVSVPFRNSNGVYEPVADAASTTGYTDLLGMQNVNGCSSFNCFRPCGVAVHSNGWVFVTSDAAIGGELFLLGRL